MSDESDAAPPPSEPDAIGAGVLSIDAMGGDLGPEAVVAGLAAAVKATPAMRFLVHGDRVQLDRLVARRRSATIRTPCLATSPLWPAWSRRSRTVASRWRRRCRFPSRRPARSLPTSAPE